MKYLKRYTFLGLFCILHVFDGVLCISNLYEQISPYIQDSEYVDPHSLYYNRQSQTVQAPKPYKGADEENSEMVLRDSDSYQSYCRDSAYQVFSRRLINMLIMRSNLKINNGIATGHIDIEATVEELEILKSFGEGKISIRQVDGIISDIVLQAKISLFDEALNYTDQFSIYLYQHRVIFGAVLIFFFIIAIALKIKWTRLRIIFLLVDVMIIFSFMLTWWELIQEVEIKLVAQQAVYHSMPDECQQDKIGLKGSILLFFGIGKGDCAKYYEAIMTDPILKVTPLHAFSHMCTKFFFHPIALAGHYLSDFIDGFTNSIPWPLNIIVKLLLILLIPGFLSILLFVYLGGSMGVRFGPFLHVYLHGRQSTPPTNSLISNDRQTIEIIKNEITESLANLSNQTKTALPATLELHGKEKSIETKHEENSNLKRITVGKKEEIIEENCGSGEEFSEEGEYDINFKTAHEDEIEEINHCETKSYETKEEDHGSELDLSARNDNTLQVRKRIIEITNVMAN